MRKKIFLLVSYTVLFYFVLQANTQIFSNTIVNNNSSWAILGYVVCSGCPVWTEYIYFDSDSIVADYSYKKIFSYRDKLHENIKYEGLIREQDNKTYFIPADSETEYLLYDFSLEEGTDFEYTDHVYGGTLTKTFYVKQIDSVEINGVQKKRIQLAESSFPFNENMPTRAIWIEGIGSLDGLFQPCGMLAPGSVRTLLCYFQDNELIYKNPSYSECYYDKEEDIISVQTIATDNYRIFPNPVENILNISCSDNTISKIEIIDNLGRKVYNQSYRDTIDVSSFSKGLYLLKVYDINDHVSVFKIIKK